MNSLTIGFAVLACVIGLPGDQPGPRKGLCPLKEGIMRAVPPDSSIMGTMKATVLIYGKDNLVRSATDGRVRDAIFKGRIAIMRDTATYTYFGLDSTFVQEGQLVKAGQAIGHVSKPQVYFFVSNYLYTHINPAPQDYVDCVCKLPQP